MWGWGGGGGGLLGVVSFVSPLDHSRSCSYTVVYNQCATREETLDTELAEEQGRDEKRQRFAQLASEMREFADATTAKVGELAGSLEEQLEALKALEAEYKVRRHGFL